MNDKTDKPRHFFQWKHGRLCLLYLAAALIMHIDRFILRAYALVKTHDQFDSYWPMQKALAERIIHLQMPGWLPDIAGGIPFFIWDVNWLFLPVLLHGIFPEPWSVTAITVTEFFLAGFGMHIFLKKIFKLEESACFFGGLLWALSTFTLTYWRIFDLAVLPLLLFCIDGTAFSESRKPRLYLVGGLLLCGMNLWLIKGALFLIPFQFFFILTAYSSWKEIKRVTVVFVLFWGFVFLLNLPMVVSLLVNASQSSRKLIEWFPQDTSWEVILNSIFWFFFNPIHQSFITLGFVASLFVFYSIWRFRSWNGLMKKMAFYYILVLFLAHFVFYSSWFIAFWQSLPVSGFRLYRLIMVGPFILFLAAMVKFQDFFDFFVKFYRRSVFLVVLTAAVPIVIQFKRNVFPSNIIESSVIVLMATVTLGGLLILRKKGAEKRAYFILFTLLIIIERFLQVNLTRPLDFHPPSFVHFYQSELFDRFRPAHKYDYRIALINQHPVVGLYNNYQVAGGIGQYSKRYYYFWDALISGEEDSKAFHDYYHMAYLYAEKVKRDATPPLTIDRPGFQVPLLALHNVKYIFSFNEIQTPSHWGISLVLPGRPPERLPGMNRGFQIFKRIFEPIPYYVYRVDDVLPRVFTAGAYGLIEGNEALKMYLRNKTADDLRKTVVYNREDLTSEDIRLLSTLPSLNDTMKHSSSEKPMEPKINFYSDNQIMIQVHSPRLQQLVLNENFFRDWTATINDHPVTILPAYGVFRSVIIDKGENQIIFRYNPAYLKTSLWISGLGGCLFLLLGLGWAYFGARKEPCKRHSLNLTRQGNEKDYI